MNKTCAFIAQACHLPLQLWEKRCLLPQLQGQGKRRRGGCWNCCLGKQEWLCQEGSSTAVPQAKPCWPMRGATAERWGGYCWNSPDSGLQGHGRGFWSKTKVSSGSLPWLSRVCDVRLEGWSPALVICGTFPLAIGSQGWRLGVGACLPGHPPGSAVLHGGRWWGKFLADPWRKPAAFLVSWDSVNFLITVTPIISGDCLSQPVCPSSHKDLSHRPSCSLVAITHPLPNPQALRPRVKIFGGISSREETCHRHGNCYCPLWAACT